ncbi:MAG: ion transporter [Chlorobi bacterium]|nr:ion transporter [Chlorobiota bacterium]
MNIRKLKSRLYTIIFEADTFGGKLFDIILLILIVISVLTVILETVPPLQAKYGDVFNLIEWVITILFSIEYLLRVWVSKNPKAYIFSFFGIIDFLSAIPKYLSYFVAGSQLLIALRALRLLRIFKILKLSPFMGEAQRLTRALKASRHKIMVFLLAVIILTVILGTIMYLVEYGAGSGFDSIPKSIYWAIVTLTTVGYGDIAPVTPLGQFIASLIMILGYGIIAVPTGIVTTEMTRDLKVHTNTQVCPYCHEDTHVDGAVYCHRCGNLLNPDDE